MNPPIPTTGTMPWDNLFTNLYPLKRTSIKKYSYRIIEGGK